MTSLSLEHLPLLGYFALIGALLLAVLPNLARKPNLISVVFILLAFASLGSTWTYMFKYFQRSFEDSALRAGVSAADYTTQAWLADVSLFKEAWQYVCETPQRWWWSEQLCLWTTGPLTIVMAIEARRHNIKRAWAFMLLGQVVAVSFAQSLFFAALAVAPPAQTVPRGPPAGALGLHPAQGKLTWWLLGAVIIANGNVAFTPHTLFSTYFLPNLLLMHVVLLAPLVFRDEKTAPMTLSRFYLNIGLVALRFRAPTAMHLLGDTPKTVAAVLPKLPEIFKAQWVVLNEYPAQQSIGWDVIFATVSALVYVAWSSRSSSRADERVNPIFILGAVVATPIVGISTSAGVILALREGKKEVREDALKKMDEARKAEALKEMAALGENKKKK
ncbi:hypothetical protein JCM6882_002429 [Rhodosporidiobolus microsporus]